MKELAEILVALAHPAAFPSALATLVQVEGSSYRRTGARLLLRADDVRVGSISGGCLEDDVLERARQVRATGAPQVAVYDTTSENDLVWGVGLGCHGVVHVLIERLPSLPAWAPVLAAHQRERQETALAVVYGGVAPAFWGTRLVTTPSAVAPGATVFQQAIPAPVALVIFGAGDDAKPLVRFGKDLGWHVTVIDPRPTYSTSTRFPAADSVQVAPAAEAAARVRIDARTAVVIMTHHYVHDLPLLSALLPQPLLYLGLLGPKKRAEKMLADLASQGHPFTSTQRARLRGPVGLDLGGDEPESVALAIVAEIQATLAGRDARPLRERLRPIHQ